MRKTTLKIIVLKKDWDIPLRISLDRKNFEGHFVGRERELDLLVNEILHKNNGSILVSGHRGVGKTSLVYKALSKVLEQNENVLIVLMNAAQLEVGTKNKSEENSIEPREIIENLIRRLYTATRSSEELRKEIKEDIENLYRKAIAKEFKLTEFLTEKTQRIKQEEEEKTKEILLSEKILPIVIFLILWTIGTFLIILNLTSTEWLNKLLKLSGLLLAFPIPYIINLIYRKREIKKAEKEFSVNVQELYELDNRISNLEYDLEEIHKKIAQNGKKLIYVIDELDKLGINQVRESLKYFKHLFTLSDALFIFVGGEEIYNIGLNKQRNTQVYREKEYTYFTSRYFLTRPLYPDLSKFLDEIIERKEGLTYEEFEVFKRSLCFGARNDFFDLKKCIRDKITYYDENGYPIIDISDISDNKDYDQKFKLHKAITILMEGKYMFLEHSKWRENEELLRTIFNHAENIYNLFAGAQLSDPTDAEIKDELIRDFNNLLNRCGAFDIQQEDPQYIRGVQISIRTYIYVGHIPTTPPDGLRDLTEYERRFVNNFENWIGYLLSLYNAFKEAKGENKITEEELLKNPTTVLKVLSTWGYNVLNVFNNYLKIYNNIKQRTSPYPYKREVIEKVNAEIQDYLNRLKNNLHKIISHIVKQLYPSLLVQNIQQNSQLFSGSAHQIRTVLHRFNPVVVFRQPLDRQILFIYDNLNEIKRVKKSLKDNKDTHRIVMVTPMEIDEVVEELHMVCVNNPRELEEDLIRLYRELEEFLSGG